MKIKIDIDCSPQEARAFFGLPDVTALNETVTGAMQERLKAALDSTDPAALLQAWLPAMGQNVDALQRAFWASMKGDDNSKK